MMLQGLTPGVQHHGHAELGAKMRGRVARPRPEHERERDLIEAGLNEPLPQR